MTKKRRLTYIVLLVLLVVLTALAALSATGDRSAYAESPYTLRFEEPAQTYRTAEQGYVLIAFVTKELYFAYAFEITYTRVALASATEKGNLKAENGVFKNREALETKTITKEDLTVPANGTDEKYALFTLTTNVNCAWAFTVKYRNTDMDEYVTDYHTEERYCNIIDDEAPTIRIHAITTGILQRQSVSGKWRLNRILSDRYNIGGNAISGLTKATLYKRLAGKTEAEDEVVAEKFYNGSTDEQNWSEIVEDGVVAYYLEVVDAVGNSTGKQLLDEFNRTKYNPSLETAVDIALDEMGDEYTFKIKNGLSAAYGNYLSVTASSTSTEEEKKTAEADLYAALAVYQEAKEKYENGVVDYTVEVTDRTIIPSLSAVGLFRALSFTKRGSSGRIVLTPSKPKYTEKSSVLEKTTLERATDVYVVWMETQIKSASDEESYNPARQAFGAPLTLKMTLPEHEKIAAMQEVYGTDGTVTYYECIVVERTDGTIDVDVPQSSGTVYIFLDTGKREKNLYWLFALTALPLLMGAGFFAYAIVRMKKVKRSALAEREAQGENEGADKEKASDDKNGKK